jgi:hypothetical protein
MSMSSIGGIRRNGKLLGVDPAVPDPHSVPGDARFSTDQPDESSILYRLDGPTCAGVPLTIEAES